jgi:hypothetical protein
MQVERGLLRKKKETRGRREGGQERVMGRGRCE